MPRKFSRRFKRGKRRRFRRRKTMKLYKNVNTGQLSIKQKCFRDVEILPAVAGSVQTDLITFNLQEVQNAFPQVFDQFRINYVKCTFWNVSAVAGLPGSTNPPMLLYTSVDLDGQNVLPGTEEAMLERSNVKQRVFSGAGGNPQFHTHAVKPRTAKAIYSGGVLSAYGLGSRKTWLDIRSAIAAPHYGLIYQLAFPSGVVATQTMRVNLTYYLQFRKVI